VACSDALLVHGERLQTLGNYEASLQYHGQVVSLARTHSRADHLVLGLLAAAQDLRKLRRYAEAEQALAYALQTTASLGSAASGGGGGSSSSSSRDATITTTTTTITTSAVARLQAAVHTLRSQVLECQSDHIGALFAFEEASKLKQQAMAAAAGLGGGASSATASAEAESLLQDTLKHIDLLAQVLEPQRVLAAAADDSSSSREQQQQQQQQRSRVRRATWAPTASDMPPSVRQSLNATLHSRIRLLQQHAGYPTDVGRRRANSAAATSGGGNGGGGSGDGSGGSGNLGNPEGGVFSSTPWLQLPQKLLPNISSRPVWGRSKDGTVELTSARASQEEGGEEGKKAGGEKAEEEDLVRQQAQAVADTLRNFHSRLLVEHTALQAAELLQQDAECVTDADAPHASSSSNDAKGGARRHHDHHPRGNVGRWFRYEPHRPQHNQPVDADGCSTASLVLCEAVSPATGVCLCVCVSCASVCIVVNMWAWCALLSLGRPLLSLAVSRLCCVCTSELCVGGCCVRETVVCALLEPLRQAKPPACRNCI
jgi:hypothetical protein